MPTLMQGNNPIGVINKSGGSGGHVIQDASGTDMTQRANMQFTDSHVSDDSTNEKTVIENIKSVTEAQFESATEDGLYDVDVEGAEIGEISEDYVEVKGNNVKTRGELLAEIYSRIDFDKIKENSTINQNGSVYTLSNLSTNSVTYITSVVASNKLYTSTIRIASSCAAYDSAVDGNSYTRTDDLSTVIPSGYKITLYYGNDKAVVDLQTMANRCLMADGTTVQNTVGGNVETFTPTANSGCTITTVHNAFTKKVGHLRYIYLDVTINKSSEQPQIKLPFTCANVYMDISAMHTTKLVDVVIQNNILYMTYEDATSGSNRVRCSGMVMC